VEHRLGLPTGFCERLFAEDDWSFIIKLHALCEAVITTALTSAFGNPDLEPIFSRLEMSQRQIGKAAFARAANLVVDTEARFLYSLSELRNRLVHSVANVTFDLTRHVATLDINQRRNFVMAFGYWEQGDERAFEAVAKWVCEQPKEAMWRIGLMVVATMAVQAEGETARRESERLKIEYYEALRKVAATA
jgi:hypothetical protein